MRLACGIRAGNSNTNLVARAGFHMLMEELKESRAIKVEEVDPIPGENGRSLANQDTINEIIGNLMGSKWFRPTLATTSQMTDLSRILPDTGRSGAGTGGGGTTGGGTTGGGTTGAGTTGAGTTGAGTTGAPRSSGTVTPPPSQPTSGTGPAATTPVRQNATWTQDGADNVTPDRGVEIFTPSTNGNQETLVIRGTGATARVGDTATNLSPATLAGNNLLVDVPPGATRFVEITLPSQQQVDDNYHLFFSFDRPETDAMIPGYSAGQ